MTINVCIGSACHLQGSYEIISSLEKLVKNNNLEDKIVIKAAFCLGNCKKAVAVKFDDNIYSVQPDTTEEFFETVVKKKVL